jgi:integrase/recombinase XerD
MLLLTHWAGMRIGEVAALLTGDVVRRNGDIVEEINLKAHQTKGKNSRTVVLSTRMRTELQQYLLSRFSVTSLKQIVDEDLTKPLFATLMRAGFTANTACYHLFMLGGWLHGSQARTADVAVFSPSSAPSRCL